GVEQAVVDTPSVHADRRDRIGQTDETTQSRCHFAIQRCEVPVQRSFALHGLMLEAVRDLEVQPAAVEPYCADPPALRTEVDGGHRTPRTHGRAPLSDSVPSWVRCTSTSTAFQS